MTKTRGREGAMGRCWVPARLALQSRRRIVASSSPSVRTLVYFAPLLRFSRPHEVAPICGGYVTPGASHPGSAGAISSLASRAHARSRAWYCLP